MGKKGSVEMNRILGEVIVGIVSDKNDQKMYVQKNGYTYEMANNDSVELGDSVEGFVYLDKNGNAKMTTDLPCCTKELYGWGKVEYVRRDLGVFLDIGLPDKDIVVSMDILPSEKSLWPKKGDSLLIRLEQDDEDRLWGVPAEEDYFFEKIVEGTKEDHNKEIEGTVFRAKLAGTLFVTLENKIGFIHPSEREAEPRIGEQIKGRVIGLREDGVLYTSLKPRAFEALEEDSLMILEVLKRAPDHKMNLTDKSKPEDIKKALGISKAQFKRAVGRLMKQKLVSQIDGQTVYHSDKALDKEEKPME